MVFINGHKKGITRALLFLFVFLIQAGFFPLKASAGQDSIRNEAEQTGESEKPNSIEKEGSGDALRIEKNTFPWILVVGAAVVTGVLIYFLLIQKPKYALTVTLTEGVEGIPAAGQIRYKKGETVAYNYGLKGGYGNLSVTLDGQAVNPSGTVLMDSNHTLNVSADNLISNRVVVAEQFTATWCGYCPGAARGLEQLKNEFSHSFVVIAYHLSDSFNNSDANVRQAYYNVSSIPDVFFDGLLRKSGGLHDGSMYSYYRPLFDQRWFNAAPLTLNLKLAGSDTVTIEVANTSSAAVSGTLQVAVIENHIAYNWQNMTELNFVCRAMLPNAAGEMIALPVGGNQTFSRVFSLASSWNRANCRLVAFVQGASKEIFQGAEISL